MTHFIIMRESGGNYAPVGHVASPAGLDESKALLRKLQEQFPQQNFALFKLHSRAHVSHRVTVRAVDEPKSRIKRTRVSTEGNVVTINPKAKAAE